MAAGGREASDASTGGFAGVWVPAKVLGHLLRHRC